jgi:adenylate kinase
MTSSTIAMWIVLLSPLLLCCTIAGMQHGRTVTRDSTSTSLLTPSRPWGAVKPTRPVVDHRFHHDRQQGAAAEALSTSDGTPTTNDRMPMNSTAILSSFLASNGVEGRQQHPPQIILMGAPSSGKGTQSHRILEHYDVVHLSTGDMLRKAMNRDSTGGIGAIAKYYMERGALVPDEIITQLVMDRISEPDCLEKGWILDGYPRTPGQAEALKKLGIIPDLVIFLNVPDSELVERVVGRRTDRITGKIYHLKFFPPPNAEIRDRLVLRTDDTLESMTNRLQEFHSNVEAVRRCYDDVFVEVNGMGTPEKVSSHIFSIIDERRNCLKN